jgi:arylsulfotransferase ASST
VACAACSSGGAAPDGGSAGGGAGASGGGGAPVAGSGGAGAGGSAGNNTGGGGGTGGRPAGTCTFDVEHMPSYAIGTVEIVTFSLDLADLTDARIEFGPSGAAPTMTAPVDLREPGHRTLLVGMKGSKPYTFHIVATDGAKTCTSSAFSFTTGAVPSTAPRITKTTAGAGGAKGFIVTTPGVESGALPGRPDAFIFDTDGDVVWWMPSSMNGDNITTRAHLSWDTKTLWVMRGMGNCKVLRVSMDGLAMMDYSNVLKNSHHDFAVLPDGAIAPIIGNTASLTGHSIVEMRPDGTITTVVADMGTLYRAGFYPNSIHYYAADDSYTVGDRATNTNLFVKFKRNGTLVWQVGGSNPLGKSLALVGLTPWKVNHGHHLTSDGRFLFFNNGGTTGSLDMPRVVELMLDETANTATKTFEYQFSGTATALGDAERLPNGNVLVTFSFGGKIMEVDRSGAIVQSFANDTAAFGYADFRTSLYGPPPR